MISGDGLRGSASDGLAGRILNLLRSTQLGIVLLALLIIAGMIGIGNIYQMKPFNLVLVLLGLNFVLASIDHLPAAWRHLWRKQLTASPAFVMEQQFHEKIELPILGREQLAGRAAAAATAMKFDLRVIPEETQTTIFAERGPWNRLSSYAIHAGLLTIFASGLWDHHRGCTGGMWIEPEKRSDKIIRQPLSAAAQSATGRVELQLPFTIEGLDIQQQTIDQNRSVDAGIMADWITRVRIEDHETGEQTEAVVHLNHPFDYRGYRFFQAAFTLLGDARTIRLKVAPVSGGASEEVTIGRNSKAQLSDGTQLHFFEFNPSFAVNADREAEIDSRDYANPAAHLAYLKPGGERGEMWAFTEGFISESSNAPSFKSKYLDAGPYRLVLTDFEKVPHAHLLSIQYYPGTKLMYAGFTILGLALIGVFFFSHQRLWIVIEDGTIYLGGNANRNRLGFEDRAQRLVVLIREPWTAKTADD